jgi:hypothetical protein
VFRKLIVVLAVCAAALAIVAAPASAATNGRSLFGNANSGKCLEMPYSWTHDLAPAGQYTWNMAPSTGLIQNRFSGKCLEVYGWSTYDFAPVVQWTCHGGRNQVWSWR